MSRLENVCVRACVRASVRACFEPPYACTHARTRTVTHTTHRDDRWQNFTISYEARNNDRYDKDACVVNRNESCDLARQILRKENILFTGGVVRKR